MKHLIKTATTFCLSAIGMLAMMSCEGADLYKVSAPDWLADKELPEEVLNIVDVTPNPDKLGTADNTAGFWTVFTDDVKTEPGMTYQVKFVNYGGNANYKNFLIVLRNEAKDVEYAVLRADNWGWTSADTDGANSDKYFTKKMESDKRDWGTWLKAMSMAKCTALITNKEDGKADVKITMIGADNVTYTQEYTDITVDPDDLYFCFTLEGCHLEFGDFDIEDSEPVAMKLNGVPAKVKLGTSFEDAFAHVTATVTFADEVAQDVEAKNLQIQALPDMNSVGKKSLIAVYNKTKLGGNATTPVIATVDFEIVDKMYTCIGATDNSGGFASAFSEDFKVAAGETFVMTFTNYTNGAANWNNYLVELFNADKSKFYATVRADNYGWGDGYGTCTQVFDNGGDWATWLAAMDGAKVTTYVTNKGDGTADVKAVIIGNDGKTYKQEYNGITVDAADMYFHLTIEKAHLEFDTVVGAENNSGAFASDASADYMIPAGATYVTRFTNYTDGSANWNNFLVELFNADKSKFYATVRADNYGWGDGYGTCTPVFDNGGDWATWLAAMDGAKVTTYVTNKGDGTADVKAVIIGNDGKTYKQEYNGITVDAADLYFHFIIEKAHLVFE